MEIHSFSYIILPGFIFTFKTLRQLFSLSGLVEIEKSRLICFISMSHHINSNGRQTSKGEKPNTSEVRKTKEIGKYLKFYCEV